MGREKGGDLCGWSRQVAMKVGNMLMTALSVAIMCAERGGESDLVESSSWADS